MFVEEPLASPGSAKKKKKKNRKQLYFIKIIFLQTNIILSAFIKPNNSSLEKMYGSKDVEAYRKH